MLLRAHCVERECRFGAYACLVGLNQLERAAPKGKKVRALLHLMQQGEVAVFFAARVVFCTLHLHQA